MNRSLMASAALVAALVAGCSAAGASGPAAGAFAPGTCRDAAPALLGLHATARRAMKARVRDLPAVSVAVRRDQQALRALKPEAALAEPLSKVVVAAGYLRIRIDSRTYDDSLATALDAAYTAVERRCVSASPGR